MNDTIDGSMRTFWPSIPAEYSPRASPALIFQAPWDRSRVSIFLGESLYAALAEPMWTCTSIFVPRHTSFGQPRPPSFYPFCLTMALRNVLPALFPND